MLASKVKTKLTQEAVKTDVNLRRLVCQANLLDQLIESLNQRENYSGSICFDSISYHETPAVNVTNIEAKTSRVANESEQKQSNSVYYTSDDSDFDSDDSNSEEEADYNDDAEETSDVSLVEHDYHYNYLSHALQNLNIHESEYMESIEEALSSESEDECDSNDCCMLGLVRVNSACQKSSHFTNVIDESSDEENDNDLPENDNDDTHSADLPSLSNCSSMCSMDEFEIYPYSKTNIPYDNDLNGLHGKSNNTVLCYSTINDTVTN